MIKDRQSIQPTYDHRQTGDRFTVEYSINGVRLGEPTSITDPFVSGRVTIGWHDLLRCLLRFCATTVEITVRGDAEIVEDVLELDANYLGTHSSTRRKAFKARLESSLRDLADEEEDLALES
jgi:hypothetical protein